MNHFMNLKRSRWLLLTIFALLAGMPAMAQKALPYSYGFEDYNLDTDGWTKYFGTSLTKNNNECAIVGDAKRTGSYGFRFSSYQTNGANAQYLISPELNGSNGVNVSFYYKSSNTGSYGTESFKVGYSTTDTDVNNFTWGEENTTNAGSWLLYEESFPAGTKYVAIYYYSNYKYRLYVDDFSFTAPANGPALAVADGSNTINSGYNYNFGLATPGTVHYFTLSNPGTESITLNIAATDGFGVSNSSLTLEAKKSCLLHVLMADATGTGTVTITPTAAGIDPFVINVSGTVADPSKLLVNDFSSLPEDWTTKGTWYYNATNGAYTQVWYLTSNARLITPLLIVEEGETFFVKAKGYSTSNTSYQHLQMQYSADGTTWTNFDSEPALDPSNWQTFSFTGVPAGQYYIAINASQADISMFYGGAVPLVPKMKVTQPTSLNFGVITAATQKTFTIANTGKATLEGISVTSSNSSVFAISGVPTSLAAGESQEVTITMDANTVGDLYSDITVSATDMTDVVFTVTGTVLPTGLSVIDFEDNQLPARWENTGWTFSNGAAYASYSPSPYTMTTPRVVVSDGDLFVIKAKLEYYSSSYYVTVKGLDENDNEVYSRKLSDNVLNNTSYNPVLFSNVPTTVKKFQFVGYYGYIDEIQGITYDADLVVTDEYSNIVTSPDNFNFGECVADATTTYNFDNAGTGSINITNVTVTGDGAASYSTNWTTSVDTPFDLVITRTYDDSKAGTAQDAIVTVTTTMGDFVINVTGIDKAANAPEFAIFIDDVEQTTGADLGFGVITSNFGKPFTIQNNGTGALNVTAITLPDADYSTDLETAPSTESPLVVPAGGSKTVYVILTASAKAIKSGKNVVISAEGFEDFTLVADATVMPGATTIDFNNNALPDGWTNAASNKWSFDDGKAYCTAQSSSPAELVTKKLQFADDDFITISATSYDNYDDNYLEVLGSTDNGETWTAFETKKYISRSQIPYGSYATLVVDGIPSTVNKLKFRGYYVRIDEIAGLAYVDNDPTLAVYYNSEATSPVTSGTTDNFGWKKNSMGHVYYIKNDGTGTLTISDITVPEGFDYVTENDAMTVAAGADALPLTIIMMNETIGLKSGSVTLTTDGGNFEIPVKGFVYGDRNFVDFTDAAQYTGWTGVNVNSGVASLSSTAIQTTSLKATAGENLYVEMKGSSAYASKSFSYSYSNDNGETWSDAVALVASTYSSVADQVFTISNIADPDNESTVLIRFTGSNLGIDHIYGFEAIATPVMALDNADDHNFGMQTAAASYEIIVSNNGTANLENLAATLATGEDYETSVIATIVEPGSSTTIIVTQKYDASKGLASLSDVLTISADNVTPVTINLSGKTRDANKYFTDFEAGMPYGWTYTGWSRTSSGGNYYAQSDYSDLSTLRTPALTLAAGEEIKYDAWVGSTGGTFKVRYTLDGGISWTEQDVEATTTQTTKTLSLGNTEPVSAYIQFVGNYRARLDNFYGGSMNEEAPYIQVTQAGTAVENSTTEVFGTILAETSATYTITNAGGGTLTITEPIATTGDATAAVDVTSLAAGESATLTITMPVVAPYGEKSGAVTVTTSLGDFVINYTATTMDPDALNVDFSDDTMPAGWYKESGWTIYGQEIYRNLRTSDAYFMSQKLSVARTEDVLQFDAKTYGSYYASSAVLKVSYSTDRVNWTEVGDYAADMTASYKTFSISGLAAGEYYLKFEGRYASIDNIIGWKKVAGIEHDLYVTATNIPTTLAADYTATATVTSLLAAEEGVYAKLFFGDTEIATSEAANVALNGSTTFTMTATEAPEEALYEAKIVVYYSDGTVAFTTGTTTVGTLVLKETEAFAAAAGTYGAVKLNRTFNAGWNTVCLPFAAGYATTFFGEGAKAYAFTGYENGALKFERVYSLQAGVPYIVYVAEAFSEKTLTNVTITDEAAATVEFGGAILRGTYAPVAAGEWTKNLDNDVIYGVTPAGKIAKAGASASIKGFRAYFDLPAGAEVKAMLFDGDDATAIQRIDLDGAEDEVIYDLNGRRVNSNASGVLIINGKKVLKK